MVVVFVYLSKAPATVGVGEWAFDRDKRGHSRGRGLAGAREGSTGAGGVDGRGRSSFALGETAEQRELRRRRFVGGMF